MIRHAWIYIMLILQIDGAIAQLNDITGRVFEQNSIIPIEGVTIEIEGSIERAVSDHEGRFALERIDVPLGEQVLRLCKEGYLSLRIPITITSLTTLDINPIFLTHDLNAIQAEIGIISLTDEELMDDENNAVGQYGLLGATSDVFQKASAFDFGVGFYKPRGLDNTYGTVQINMLNMNSPLNGRPDWNLWGGLNDVFRNRESYIGLETIGTGFGDLAGGTSFELRPSKLKKGGSFSQALANRTYRNRIMASFSSGVSLNGWSYSGMFSRRNADQGYIEGNSYKAFSYYLGIEKSFSNGNALVLNMWYSPTSRGQSTPLTDEILEIKGRQYNPNWGFQDGRVRNSRKRVISMPTAMISFYTQLANKWKWDSSVMLQRGSVKSSRLDNSGVHNPFGHYYQRLPSYFLQGESPSVYDYQMAYQAFNSLYNDGQVHWDDLYEMNNESESASYILQDDVRDELRFMGTTQWHYSNRSNMLFHAGLDVEYFKSRQYAEVKDLLGGAYFNDIDTFYDGDEYLFNQSNSDNPNFQVEERDHYKYDFWLNAIRAGGFVQLEKRVGKWELNCIINANYTRFQRIGNFRNGYFQEGNRSKGSSSLVGFIGYGLKSNVTYHLGNRHTLVANFVFRTRPPTLLNTFANIRQNNDLVDEIKTEGAFANDLSYHFRGKGFKMRLTGYYTLVSQGTEIGIFYTENALGNDIGNAFVQEIVQDIGKKRMGFELGMEAYLSNSFSLKMAIGLGQHTFNNNPTLYLASDDFDYNKDDGYVEGSDLGQRGKRNVFMKDFHLSAGPERVIQIGFDYRDSDFWWLGTSLNYLSHAFIDPSYLRRSEDFALDADLQPLYNYDPVLAKAVLTQEQLEGYYLLNLVGGKSWLIRGLNMGFFLSLSNMLNSSYKTGGFEDSRRANYQQQVQERLNSGGPLFGNRYFLGNGPSYYLNIYMRF